MEDNCFESADYLTPLGGGGSYWGNRIKLQETNDVIIVYAETWPWWPIAINCVGIVTFFAFFYYLFFNNEGLSVLRIFVFPLAILAALGVCIGVYFQNYHSKNPKISFNKARRSFFFPKYDRIVSYEELIIFQLIIGDGWGGANLMQCNVIVKEGEGIRRYPVFRSGSMPQKVLDVMENFISRVSVPLQCVKYGIHSSPKSINYVGMKSLDKGALNRNYISKTICQ